MDEEKLLITRVDTAAFFIGDLFQRTFGEAPPVAPVHYVAFYKEDASTFTAIGYYHVTHCGEYALVGGLCVDVRYRNQGLGEKLSRIAFRDAGDKKALFAYVGNPVSDGIARRIGYVQTRQPHLMVKWLQPLPEEEKERILAEVIAIGPF
ncbi:MAG: hypothetical protein NZ578_16325 [Candidatus Binatia bacterium]|nr:hypothetical protein [Candidatus Binatia bacterium]